MTSFQSSSDGRPKGIRSDTAPAVPMNGHFAGMTESLDSDAYRNGLQVIDESQNFNENLSRYLNLEKVGSAGFNYHLISVFGSQSTGKSTLLNTLFGTNFGVMSESERRQTTKGIWMSKNKTETKEPGSMADNILVMDVEGTDGRERGEDQDFERKSALFALATSEVLIVNIWEHQVGLYQGANMGLLKVVFEVNLEIFIKDRDQSSNPRSLLFFVIRDFLGNTPLRNLRQTLMQDLERIWSGLNKPVGLENSKIGDYFDFAFAALPHKILQPERFISEVQKLGERFSEGDSRSREVLGIEYEGGVFLPSYHRRIPADGFSHYAEGVWDQIVNNKDLDLPTQQELLAQFRCDEIMREVLVLFDESVASFEEQQATNANTGSQQIISGLGGVMRSARSSAIETFSIDASRYHKGVFGRKKLELEGKVDVRLKELFRGQLSAAHKVNIAKFSEAVTLAVKEGQKKGVSYDFAEIVNRLQINAVKDFSKVAEDLIMTDAPWSKSTSELKLFQKDLVQVTSQLRRDEIRRLAARTERWVKSRLGESIGVQFNALGSGHGGSGATEKGEQPQEHDIWDRVWSMFIKTVSEAEAKFVDRAKSFDANSDEVEIGLWRLRRKSWSVLRTKIDEEMMEGNLLLKLRENFEDKFRYDEHGVPRIWRPTDDIEGLYTRARESTLILIPLLSRFRLKDTASPPPLEGWIGNMPSSATSADEEDLTPIGGVDDDDGKSLEEEMTIMNDSKRQEVTARFKKTADGVFVEAKRSAIGGMTQVPLYFYGLLLALGWNEFVAVLRNPLYFLFLIILAIAAYVTYTLNLWGPMIKMTNAASQQALEEGKKRLREFLESSDTGNRAVSVSSESIKMRDVGGGLVQNFQEHDEDGEI